MKKPYYVFLVITTFFLQDLLCAVYALFCYFCRKKHCFHDFITNIQSTQNYLSAVYFFLINQINQSVHHTNRNY